MGLQAGPRPLGWSAEWRESANPPSLAEGRDVSGLRLNGGNTNPPTHVPGKGDPLLDQNNIPSVLGGSLSDACWGTSIRPGLSSRSSPKGNSVEMVTSDPIFVVFELGFTRPADFTAYDLLCLTWTLLIRLQWAKVVPLT